VVGRAAADSGLYLPRVTSYKARYFKSISGRGSVRVIEDILLSERNGGGIPYINKTVELE